MSDLLDRLTRLSPRRLALLAMELQARLDAAERGRTEPIAIIGMGCRFPGADSPDALWQLLRDGVDAVREVPPERWDALAYYDPDPDAPGKMATRWGGFLGPVDGFDAPFFGIAPREAISMDPQQRLLLEVTWEALEHAGVAPEKLEGSATGVFLGICNNDYAQLLLGRGPEAIDAYLASGSSHSIAAGRLSYILGVHGPNLAIDTACSSSLVAVHLAVQSLRQGECRMALAGGVNLMLTPDITVALSKAHMLAPDGRCKTFDETANGFVRGEGCGMVVLKRLSDALADGDAILALIRGSAMNQDGRSNGLTAPNGPAQEAVIRAALANAGIAPHDVGLVEAHGTGTSLGDPIEVQALAGVLCAGRPASDPLMLTSIKTNMGHLESAAGIAGLMKAVLALQHAAVPPHLHLNQPSGHIPWEDHPITVPTRLTPWPAGERRRIAGVSSFGFSGTNAHILLEEAPVEQALSTDTEAPLHLLTISARSEAALAALVGRYRAYLAVHPDLNLADLCATANAGRSHFPHRLAIAAESGVQLRERLERALDDTGAPGVVMGVAKGGRRPAVALLFTGQGAQYSGMARSLYASRPVFRAALDRCAKLLEPHLERPLLEVMFAEAGSEAARLLDQTAYTQPALFALEYALAELWQSWGITPMMMLGHSVGEYVAACRAGVFSLEDALRLIAARGRLMQQLPADGAMAALMTTPERAAAALAPYRDRAAIAAINGPSNTVISGAAPAITEICRVLEAEGVKATRLTVSHAFHSPLMEPMLAAFRAVAATVTFAAPRIPVMSNLSGAPAGADMATPEYWVRQIREPVQFASGIEAMRRQGATVFLEIGPHPVLLGMAQQSIQDDTILWAPSLRRGRADWEQLLECVATLYVRGLPIDWKGFNGSEPRRRLTLPTYPFQRERFWVELPERASRRAVQSAHDDWLYEIRWLAQAHPADSPAGFMPAPAQLATQLETALERLHTELGVDSYVGLLPQLDALCSAYVLRALARLGWVWQIGQRIDAELLIRQLGINDSHRRLTGRMLAMLAEDGLLRSNGAAWEVVQIPAVADPDAMLARLLAEFPAHRAELELTGRCARALAEVLRGEADPLQLLFPGGSLDAAEDLYERSPSAVLFNSLVRTAVQGVVARIPAGRQLRVLEIGGGTGGTSSYVLPALPAERSDYLFTDVSPLFTRRAETKFAAYPFVRYGLLDISRDPGEQGLDAGRFDLVLAVNVLHATPDLRRTLAHVRQLLAPEGTLLLIEGSTPQRFGDLTVGLTDGWWSFNDDLRPDYALMGRAGWQQALTDAGFETPIFVPEHVPAAGALAQQALIMARTPGVEATAETAQTWLILSDVSGVGAALAERLEARGVRCVRAFAGAAYQRTAADRYVLDAANPEHYRTLLHDLVHSDRAPNCVVHLWSVDAVPSDAMNADALQALQMSGSASVLHLVQALLGAGLPAVPRLCLVTRGAQPAEPGAPVAAGHATIWGLGNTITLEHPELACLRVDLEAGNAAQIDALLHELRVPDPAEHQVALRRSGRFVRKLARVAQPPTVSEAVRFDPDAGYLITGGLSGLGLLTAEWMVQHGARRLALMGRSAPGQAARAALDRMQAAGAQILVVQGDVARRADLERALAELSQRQIRLAGVIHSAGALDDGVLTQQTWERFQTVYAAKVIGAWNLHQLTRHLPLEFFVLFSSGVSLLGTRGQGNHAAANAFLDVLAHQRRAAGLPALSINWGAWAEIGAVVKQNVGERLARQGQQFIDPASGLAMLERLIGLKRPQIAVLPIERTQLSEQLRQEGVPPLLSLLVTEHRPAEQSPAVPLAVAEPALAQRLAEALPSQRRGLLLAHVRRYAAQVLRVDPAQIDAQQPLHELGLDSLMAVELRNVLGRSVEQTLPATLTYEYPSVAAIAEFLGTMLEAAPEQPAEIPEEPASAPQDLDDLSEDDLATLLAARLSKLR